MRAATRRLSTATGQAANWCENVAFRHRRFASPESLPELQDLVAEAAHVRVLGSGHSFSSLCRSEDTLVSLAFMRNILDVEATGEAEMRVRVEGGATIGDVVKHLAPRGFALRNVPSLPHVTVAGALATSTHGSGLQPGAEGGLPSTCRAIEFVKADGSLVEYERGRDVEFEASVVHLGALGVVSRVSLEVVPAFEVEQRVYDGVDLDQVILRFEELARSVDSLTVGINFGVGGGQGAGMLWMRYFDAVAPEGPGGRTTYRGTCPPPGSMARAPLGVGGRLRHEPVPFYESRVGVPATRSGPWHDVPSFFMDDMAEINMPMVRLSLFPMRHPTMTAVGKQATCGHACPPPCPAITHGSWRASRSSSCRWRPRARRCRRCARWRGAGTAGPRRRAGTTSTRRFPSSTVS